MIYYIIHAILHIIHHPTPKQFKYRDCLSFPTPNMFKHGSTKIYKYSPGGFCLGVRCALLYLFTPWACQLRPSKLPVTWSYSFPPLTDIICVLKFLIILSTTRPYNTALKLIFGKITVVFAQLSFKTLIERFGRLSDFWTFD